MAVARSHECPNCGGLVRENARTCGFCRSPLATVRCSICYTMNVTEASYCLACGTELGLEPLAVGSDAKLSCPRCAGLSLDGFSNGDGPLYDCAGCGGQFVDPHTLRIMVERHRARSDGGGGGLTTPPSREARITYLRCPVCRELMHRRNFGRTSGVIVDVCEIHGTWFDVGELPWILGFVARGGLERGQLVELQEKERLIRAERSSISGSSRSIGVSAGDVEIEGRWEDLAEAIAQFVRWVLERRITRF